MARTANPVVRAALLDAAAGLIASEGLPALTLRRLADTVGTSTMAIYTHFGGMEDVRRELRREGFTRLAEHLFSVQDTGDPVADLVLLGWQYYLNATTNPNLYRVMFTEQPLDETDTNAELATFHRLTYGVQRCIDAHRFIRADATELATTLWALNHGIVTLQLAGMLTADQAIATLSAGGASLFKAHGDDARATGSSFGRARQRAGLEG